jgi:DNA mismatch repair protein MutS
VHVAELAGVPKSVVRRAATLLSALEKQSGPLAVGGVLGALPLFAAAAVPNNVEENAPPDIELRRALAEIDPDRLTPREALDALYRLRALLPASAGDQI